MGEKRQSIISKILKRHKARRDIAGAYRTFKRECGIKPALSEELFFKSCCAGLIEDLGFIPSTYPGDAAAYLKLRYEGKIPAGWPTEKAKKETEAH